jgi:hypothetical protein
MTICYSGKNEDWKSLAYLKGDQFVLTVPLTSEITADGQVDIHNIHTSWKRHRPHNILMRLTVTQYLAKLATQLD